MLGCRHPSRLLSDAMDEGEYRLEQPPFLRNLRPTGNPRLRVYLERMQSLSFARPVEPSCQSNSTAVPWTAVFEDEGIAGYFYACDRSQQTQEESIMDAMLIYNVDALAKSDAELRASPRPPALRASNGRATGSRPCCISTERRRRSLTFSSAAAIAAWTSPTFWAKTGDTWRKTTHAWNENALCKDSSRRLYV